MSTCALSDPGKPKKPETDAPRPHPEAFEEAPREQAPPPEAEPPPTRRLPRPGAAKRPKSEPKPS